MDHTSQVSRRWADDLPCWCEECVAERRQDASEEWESYARAIGLLPCPVEDDAGAPERVAA